MLERAMPPLYSNRRRPLRPCTMRLTPKSRELSATVTSAGRLRMLALRTKLLESKHKSLSKKVAVGLRSGCGPKPDPLVEAFRGAARPPSSIQPKQFQG